MSTVGHTTDVTVYGEPIVTGEAVAVEIRTAGIGSRGIALLVDALIQTAVALVLGLVLLRRLPGDAAAIATVALVFYVLLVLGYPVGFETLWRGRTPGKAVMGLRVVRDDGGPIRFRHAFVRGLVGVVVDRPGVSFMLLALVPMLVTVRNKRLGDIAAGTVVVQDRVPARLDALPTMPAALAGWAAGLDLSGLTDDLALEVRHFLGRSRQLTPAARTQLGDRLVDEVARRTAPPPPGVDGWTYLSTVLAERRRRAQERLTAFAAVPPMPPGAAERPPPAQPPDDPGDARVAGPFAPPG